MSNLNAVNAKGNPVTQQGSSNEAAQIDREIRVLKEQIRRVGKDDKMTPESKAKKENEINQKIMRLQERKVQAQQQAQNGQAPRENQNALHLSKTKFDRFVKSVDKPEENPGVYRLETDASGKPKIEHRIGG
jgi:chromosome segregation ATPase